MKRHTIILISCLTILFLFPQAKRFPGTITFKVNAPLADTSLDELFLHPPDAAKPWVVWYWMQAAVTKEGITADLEAMKQAHLGGAYMMFIKGVDSVPLVNPPAQQLSPHWWELVMFAIQEAKRLNIQLGMHVSDGFALAGGPWIKPEMSMQRVVSSKIYVAGKKQFNGILPQPETKENYYKDIAVYAFPTPIKKNIADTAIKPVVTSSVAGISPQYLTDIHNRQSFRSDSACWIQYAYAKPFTVRSIVIHPSGTNYPCRQLRIEVSNDGKQFKPVERMQSPRTGWQDFDFDLTYAIKPTTARYFRFIYDKEGLEPGSEDLDFAKWKPVLKINGIILSNEPVIHQYEGKSGAVWRVSKRTTAAEAPDSLCVPLNKIINITDKMTPDGHLTWDVPAGNWTIIRVGHTSTGQRNATGGGGKGLECDKFNPAAVRLQFDSWFGEALRRAGPDITKEVLKMLHLDSWECGSQNWSPVFRDEFKKRRGYDCLPYMIAMTGVPVQSADVSERFLYDVRQTIMELVKDNFYITLKNAAREKGCIMSAESVAPTMVSDGLLHYQVADIPLGEFWLNSPTHDKPNDMFDAISGGHIYGKPIIGAEAFTELRIGWDEHPGNLKALQDRNYALGINRMIYHVFMHNPWVNRAPGMTLNGIGLYFQRNQTWWPQAGVWVEYAQRCQTLLQKGKPVVDVAVFTGEDIPRRSVLPDRLVSTLPGIFGDSVVQAEKKRLANTGNPLRTMPEGVTHSANMADPEKWIDPLHGYAYDCFNPDVLLKATVRNGRVEFPGGASYKVLVLPQPHPMSPVTKHMMPAVAKKLEELVKAGATIIVNDAPERSYSLEQGVAADKQVKTVAATIWKKVPAGQKWKVGKGTVVQGPYKESSFESLGVIKDFAATENTNDQPAKDIAWTHRAGKGFDIYFISNQRNEEREISMMLRGTGRLAEIWDPVTGEQNEADFFRFEKGCTKVSLRMPANGSLFIVLRKPTKETNNRWYNVRKGTRDTIQNAWTVTFDPKKGGPAQPVVFDQLKDWSKENDPAIKYYSGTAVYTTTFDHESKDGPVSKAYIEADGLANIAEIYVNGEACGVIWTAPYRVDISKALHAGKNELKIEVTNTWFNRLKGDLLLPEKERITQTNAPFWAKDKPLLPAGLLGPVTIVRQK